MSYFFRLVWASSNVSFSQQQFINQSVLRTCEHTAKHQTISRCKNHHKTCHATCEVLLTVSYSYNNNIRYAYLYETCNDCNKTVSQREQSGSFSSPALQISCGYFWMISGNKGLDLGSEGGGFIKALFSVKAACC